MDLSAYWAVPIQKTADWLSEKALGHPNAQLSGRLAEAAGFRQGQLLPQALIATGTSRQIEDAWQVLLDPYGLKLEGQVEKDAFSYLHDTCIQEGQIVPLADFGQLLPELKNSGYLLGVVTSDDEVTTMDALKAMGIAGYFDAVETADQLSHAKPDPEGAMRFASRFGLQPGEMAYVGDSPGDMQFARNAGMHGILLRQEDGQPLPPGTETAVHSLMDLPDVLQEL